MVFANCSVERILNVVQFWILLILFWPVAILSQTTTPRSPQPLRFSFRPHEAIKGMVFRDTGEYYAVKPHEMIIGTLIGDFKGIGQKGAWLRIMTTPHYMDHLVFYDPESQREFFGRQLTSGEETNWFQVDIEGDGILELMVVTPWLYNPKRFETDGLIKHPTVTIYRISNGNLIHNEQEEFYGQWASVGNMTGDLKDELILFQYPNPDNDYYRGPIDILVLSWNRNKFEQIAQVSLPAIYLHVDVFDINNDGRDEIIALKSGYDKTGKPRPIKLAIYSYVEHPELALIDEVDFQIELSGVRCLNHLWTQSLKNGGYRIIVPIPEIYVEGKGFPGILEYRSYRLIANRLFRDPEPLDFKWESYNGDLPLSLSWPPSPKPQVVKGYLQIRDKKGMEFIREDASDSPKQ